MSFKQNALFWDKNKYEIIVNNNFIIQILNKSMNLCYSS